MLSGSFLKELCFVKNDDTADFDLCVHMQNGKKDTNKSAKLSNGIIEI